MNKKAILLSVVAGVAVVVAAIVAFHSMSGGGAANVQSNVTEFAKSIDKTKADTPSVPADRIALGRTGPAKGRR